MPGFELNVTEQILDGANRTVEVVVDPPQSNLAGLRLAYDEHGRLTSRTAVERTGAPMRNPFNAGVVSTVYEYDIAGRRSAVGWRSFGDVHVIGPLGCATLTFRYDDRGNEAELACLGVDGEPFPLATCAEASQPAIKFAKIQREADSATRTGAGAYMAAADIEKVLTTNSGFLAHRSSEAGPGCCPGRSDPRASTGRDRRRSSAGLLPRWGRSGYAGAVSCSVGSSKASKRVHRFVSSSRLPWRGGYT